MEALPGARGQQDCGYGTGHSNREINQLQRVGVGDWFGSGVQAWEKDDDAIKGCGNKLGDKNTEKVCEAY